MLVTLLGIVMLVRLVQPRNIPSKMLVTPEVAVKVTVAKFEQFLNSSAPILLVNPFPMVAVVKPEQPANAPCPMFVTLLGMVMLVRLVHPRNP